MSKLAQSCTDLKGGVYLGSMLFLWSPLPHQLPGNGPAWFGDAPLASPSIFWKTTRAFPNTGTAQCFVGPPQEAWVGAIPSQASPWPGLSWIFSLSGGPTAATLSIASWLPWKQVSRGICFSPSLNEEGCRALWGAVLPPSWPRRALALGDGACTIMPQDPTLCQQNTASFSFWRTTVLIWNTDPFSFLMVKMLFL